MSELAADALAAVSDWIDVSNRTRFDFMTREEVEAELLLMHRTIKVAEEIGESVEKLIGFTGANPRKGKTSARDDVVNELLDVAVSALGAVEHLSHNDASALKLLDNKIIAVALRAGVIV